MSDNNELNYSHRIYHNDPIKFKNLINKQVKVVAKDSSVHHGILYTVDPVSESIILIEPVNNGTYKANIIVGHSVESMDISTCDESIDTKLPDFFIKKNKILSDDELLIKKELIKNLLIENRFPVEENNNGILKIHGMLSIHPPYDFDDCFCTNPIIMTRIHKILTQVSS